MITRGAINQRPPWNRAGEPVGESRATRARQPLMASEGVSVSERRPVNGPGYANREPRPLTHREVCRRAKDWRQLEQTDHEKCGTRGGSDLLVKRVDCGAARWRPVGAVRHVDISSGLGSDRDAHRVRGRRVTRTSYTLLLSQRNDRPQRSARTDCMAPCLHRHPEPKDTTEARPCRWSTRAEIRRGGDTPRWAEQHAAAEPSDISSRRSYKGGVRCRRDSNRRIGLSH
jgi:hypothetical protein